MFRPMHTTPVIDRLRFEKVYRFISHLKHLLAKDEAVEKQTLEKKTRGELKTN